MERTALLAWAQSETWEPEAFADANPVMMGLSIAMDITERAPELWIQLVQERKAKTYPSIDSVINLISEAMSRKEPHGPRS